MPEETNAPTELGIGPVLESPERTDQNDGQQDSLFPPSQNGESVHSSDTPGQGQGGSADEFNWRSVNDLRRLDLSTVPERQREMYEHFQRQVRTAQGDSSARLEDLRRREQMLEDRQNEVLKLQQHVAQQPNDPRAAGQQQRPQSLDQMLQNPRLDRDTRNGMMLVQRALNDALEPFRPLLEQFPHIQQQMGQISQERSGQLRQNFVNQASEARAKFGDDIDNYAADVYRMTGTDPESGLPISEPLINRATGQPHTVESAYLMVSGKMQQMANGMREEDASLRREAQDGMAGVGAGAGVPTSTGTGTLNEDQAKAELRDLGFGRA